MNTNLEEMLDGKSFGHPRTKWPTVVVAFSTCAPTCRTLGPPFAVTVVSADEPPTVDRNESPNGHVRIVANEIASNAVFSLQRDKQTTN